VETHQDAASSMPTAERQFPTQDAAPPDDDKTCDWSSCPAQTATSNTGVSGAYVLDTYMEIYMELQEQTLKPTDSTAQLEITDSASGECCGNDLVGKARSKIHGQIAERVIALIVREDAVRLATGLPPMLDRECLFLVWQNNACQAVNTLNGNARSDNEKWTVHRLAKAIHTNFGCTWPNRNRQESGYTEFCRREDIAILKTIYVMSRKRDLKCTVQGCQASALRQSNGKFFGACLEIEINRESKQSAKFVSSDSLPGAISASTGQQKPNGQFYCVVQKLIEIHALQHLIYNICFIHRCDYFLLRRIP